MVVFKYELVSFIMFSLCTQTAQQYYQSSSQQQASNNAMKCQQLPVLRGAARRNLSRKLAVMLKELKILQLKLRKNLPTLHPCM